MARLIGSICAPCLISEAMANSTLTATLGQVVRYALIGVVNNLLGYLIYL